MARVTTSKYDKVFFSSSSKSVLWLVLISLVLGLGLGDIDLNEHFQVCSRRGKRRGGIKVQTGRIKLADVSTVTRVFISI